jgi:hypothetical protein
VDDPDRPAFAATQLKVFDRPPEDAINATVHEGFLRPAQPELPRLPAVAKSWWEGQSERWRRELQEKVFRGWPAQPTALAVRPAADLTRDGVRLRAYDFTSEEAIDLRLWLLTAEKVEKPSLVVLTGVDEAGWQEWLPELGPAFREALQVRGALTRDDARFDQNRKALEFHRWAFATLAPRGVGPTRWAEPGSAADTHFRRRFALLGQTLDGQRVWDVRRALAVLRGLPALKGVPLWLQGKGDTAGVVLYAALFEPDVARLDLWYPPASHRQGPTFLNVRRLLDLPQAVALAFPRPVRLYVKDGGEARAWEWPLELQKLLGKESLKIRQVSP